MAKVKAWNIFSDIAVFRSIKMIFNENKITESTKIPDSTLESRTSSWLP